MRLLYLKLLILLLCGIYGVLGNAQVQILQSANPIDSTKILKIKWRKIEQLFQQKDTTGFKQNLQQY